MDGNWVFVSRAQMEDALKTYSPKPERQERPAHTGKMIFFVDKTLGETDPENVIAYYAEEGSAAGKFYLRADLVK